MSPTTRRSALGAACSRSAAASGCAAAADDRGLRSLVLYARNVVGGAPDDRAGAVPMRADSTYVARHSRCELGGDGTAEFQLTLAR